MIDHEPLTMSHIHRTQPFSKFPTLPKLVSGMLPPAFPNLLHISQPRPQGFSLKKWVGREKALASAGHVHSLNIPEKLIYMQPVGFALTEVERSNNGK